MCVQVCLCWGRISLWEDCWLGQVFLTVALLKPRDRQIQIAQGFLLTSFLSPEGPWEAEARPSVCRETSTAWWGFFLNFRLLGAPASFPVADL